MGIFAQPPKSKTFDLTLRVDPTIAGTGTRGMFIEC
jgi:hypothetical protein